MSNKFYHAVKQMAWGILSSFCLVLSVHGQEADSSWHVVKDALPSKDSLKNDINSVTKDYRVKTDSVLSRGRQIRYPELDSLRSEINGKTKQTTRSLKDDAAELLDGDGLTNENASEKVFRFVETAMDEGALEDKARNLTENISLDGVKQTVDRFGDKPDKALDKLSSTTERNISLDNVKRVFSDKQIKLAYDSLLTKVDWNVVNSLLQNPSAVSEGSILEAVFVKFPGLSQLSKARQDATLLSGMMSGANAATSLSSLAAVHLHDLKRLKVDDSLMATLPSIRGRQLDARSMKYADKYWKKLDSLRNVNLKEEGLKIGERKLSDSTKATVIKKRLRFFQKIYFEGVVGLFNGANNGNINLVQLSPSLGYHLHKNFSLGFGPSVILQMQEKDLNALLGLRSFAKYEMLQYNMYVQLEHNLLFPHVDRSNVEKFDVPSQQALFGGLGYLLPLTKRISINLNILYRVAGENQLPGMVSGSSPWLYRIGVSSNRLKKSI